MALFSAFSALYRVVQPNNNMTDDTQMDPMVGGEEEVAPIEPADEGMEEMPMEAAPEAGDEEAA